MRRNNSIKLGTYHNWDYCPDCGKSCSRYDKACSSCGFNFAEDEPTESESSMGIDPYDY